MKLNDYAKWTINTCAKLETTNDDINHMLFGMMTEVGELVDAIVFCQEHDHTGPY